MDDAAGDDRGFEEATGPIAVMEVALTAPSEIVAGEPVAFELAVVNRGPDQASAATAQMVIPDGLVVDPASTPEGCAVVGNLVSCEVGDLAVSQAATRTIRAQVASDVRLLEVEASVQADEGGRTTTTGPLAVLDPATVERITKGLRSTEGTIAVVLLTAVICGAFLLALTRESWLRKKPTPRH